MHPWQRRALPLPWGSPDRILQLTCCFVSPPQGPLLKGKRCVVLADGFYEWQQRGGGKQPYFIYFPQNKKHPVLRHRQCLSTELHSHADTWGRAWGEAGNSRTGMCRGEFSFKGALLLVPQITAAHSHTQPHSIPTRHPCCCSACAICMSC